jgi:hypothetical protein
VQCTEYSNSAEFFATIVEYLLPVLMQFAGGTNGGLGLIFTLHLSCIDFRIPMLSLGAALFTNGRRWIDLYDVMSYK